MTTGDDNAALPAAGWYSDAANPERERLWTGERWIDWVRPLKAGRLEPVPTGWYPDAGHEGFERLWAGEMWTEEIRRTPVQGLAEAPVPVAVSVGTEGAGSSVQTLPLTLDPQQQWSSLPVPTASVSYQDPRPPYKLWGLGAAVRFSFVALVISALARLIANQNYIGVENEITEGQVPQLAHVQSLTDAVHTTATITLIVEIITAILFIVWFARAYRNLVRVGISDLRFAPGWAIGGWFIPIFNLIRQKQIANDIWKASASAGTIGLARRQEIPLSGVLNWWWGTWLVSGLLAAIGGGQVRHANSTTLYTYSSISDERSGLWWIQASLVVIIVAAVLAFIFVREVSRLQDEHFRPGA